MSTVRNCTTGASGTDPASGYNLMLSHLFIVFFLFLYKLSVNTINPYTTIMLLIFTHSMIYFMIFRIKIYRKMAKTLTEKTKELFSIISLLRPAFSEIWLLPYIIIITDQSFNFAYQIDTAVLAVLYPNVLFFTDIESIGSRSSSFVRSPAFMTRRSTSSPPISSRCSTSTPPV
jgi:hypothetical protein